jgi:Zn-dependent protease/CBS domain-containing protein
MRGSLKIMRIAGIDIGIHYTWIFAVIIITWSLAGYYSQLYPSWSVAVRWLGGLLSSVLLFFSVLLHELAHSLVAQSKGLPVSSITLFIFGGVSNLTEEPREPGLEFWMAIVGPLTSILLGLVFWVIWYGATGDVLLPFLSRSEVGKGTFIIAVVGYLAFINLALAVFNLLPGFPLDGGRVLRSILWKISNSLTKATNIASTIGRFFGWAFIGLGVYFFFFYDFLSAVWIGIIGIFLMSAAENARHQVMVRENLADVKVSQAMELNNETVSLHLTVADLVREFFLSRRRRAVPVADGDHIVGMVSISDVRKLPQEQWETSVVEGIMTREPLYSVKPGDTLDAALKVIAQHDLNQVPVIDQGKLVGILTRANVINYLQLRQELGMKRGRNNSWSSGSNPS